MFASIRVIQDYNVQTKGQDWLRSERWQTLPKDSIGASGKI